MSGGFIWFRESRRPARRYVACIAGTANARDEPVRKKTERRPLRPRPWHALRVKLTPQWSTWRLKPPSVALAKHKPEPGNWFVRSGSDGLLAMIGSIVLFALGIVVAWTRHRWEQQNETDS